MKRFARARDTVATKFYLTNETLTKPWINMNKEQRTRDIIVALKDPNPNVNRLERKSAKMAEVAKRHHEELQEEGWPVSPRAHERRIRKVLAGIEEKITESQKCMLSSQINREDIKKAMDTLHNGKAAGMDGIIHELWVELAERHEERQKDDKPGFDVIGALTTVFQDIQEYGIECGSCFAEGWLCPIYKKGDKTNIGNYRPITVLNADYKILTKALLLRLSEVAPYIIHGDQAGFMKGRRIEDQTELAHTVIEWCNITGKNGMIVCLDQEKAYDKILHDFLWASMKKFGIPDEYIDIVRSLYSDANTKIILNGEVSRSYKVKRGVRQGDPLSCLLFNIAIESLAHMLHSSTLKGIDIDGEIERLIATLFADDTTAYLAKDDKFQDLQKLLKKWCRASGAKFNIPKTVIVPVGTKEYREGLATTRKTSPTEPIIPLDIKIVREGEATRLLGAFIGNGIDRMSVWTPTIETIAHDLTRWKKGNPTIEGKRLIIGMVIGGRTQYRTRVQGMPKQVEDLLTKMIRDFIWGENT